MDVRAGFNFWRAPFSVPRITRWIRRYLNPRSMSQWYRGSSQEDQELILRHKYRECETQMQNFTSSSGACDMIWDGIYCWPQTRPGDLATIHCPDYISGFDPRKNATKMCTASGWWFDQDLNRTWTNYTDCYTANFTGDFVLPFGGNFQTSPTIKQYIPAVKLISKIGYGISLAVLIVAFLILAVNKRLRCARNMLHLNLFVSFIMRAFMALLKDHLFFDGVGLRDSFLSDNGEVVLTLRAHRWECKIFTTVWQYCILANYSWILMEGIYLYNLTFRALFLDTSSIAWHVTMGWTAPALVVLPWVFVRALYEDTYCWTTNDNKLYFLIIKIPIVLSILINLVLFLNITRVLLNKLNTVTSTRIARYRKWAKSTLILMPLYGVHYALFLGMSYSEDPTVEIVWLFCDQLFGSSQGFCVALLYCILNGEVTVELKRKFHGLRAKREDADFPLRHRAVSTKSPARSTPQDVRVYDLDYARARMEGTDSDESSSQAQGVTGLTSRLVDFAPNGGEQLTEEQESALKNATAFFFKQLMLQQNKISAKISHASLVNSASDICRICRGARSKEDLLTTCGCKGTMGFIHLSCLEHWLAVSDSTKCELCSFQYETVRTPKYSVLKSILLWLQSPGCRRDAREIVLDLLALIVFTPMAFFGTYMTLLAAETWYDVDYYRRYSWSPLNNSLFAATRKLFDRCWLQCLSFFLLWADRLLVLTGSETGRYQRKLLFLIMLVANILAYQNIFSPSEWYSAEETVLVSPTMTKIVSLGCLGVVGGIDTAYLSWLLLRVQHHARAWHRWRRRNSIVKVILPPQKIVKEGLEYEAMLPVESTSASPVL